MGQKQNELVLTYRSKQRLCILNQLHNLMEQLGKCMYMSDTTVKFNDIYELYGYREQSFRIYSKEDAASNPAASCDASVIKFRL